MKNLLIYIHPRKDFDEEGKIAVKIQIDNSLDLGWKREDIMLVTNFPYQYNGVKSIILNDDVYCNFDPAATKTSATENLFERGLIDKDELYWVHDLDAYQMEIITESELDLREADMGITDRGIEPKLQLASSFFKIGAKDIFGWLKEIMYKYQKNRITDEYILTALITNNLLLVTDIEANARQKVVPINIPGAENLPERVKKLNISYNMDIETLSRCYGMASKPIKVAHFHFSIDRLLDSAMYGKNSINKPLMSERLIKIFHKHGVKGAPLKKMRNLMIYINPEKKFLGNTEDLVKKQIDNSLKLGWKVEDIVLVTDFPYEYHSVNAMVIDNHDQAPVAGIVFYLLNEDVVKEAELWWFHDLDVFQSHPIDSSLIDLDDTTAGFINTGNFFFRKGSNKLFEWMRNRTARLDTDEKAAFLSLTTANYRNINSMYKILSKKLAKIFSKQ